MMNYHCLGYPQSCKNGRLVTEFQAEFVIFLSEGREDRRVDVLLRWKLNELNLAYMA
jgi:hypothetical protein